MFTLGIFFIALGWCLKADPGTEYIGKRSVSAGLILICLDLAISIVILLAMSANRYMPADFPHLWNFLQ